MEVKRVQVSNIINANRDETFRWFYNLENFTSSPIVFRSKWRKNSTKNCSGSIRDIVMIAGWYKELITDVTDRESIQYKVLNSFPKIRQDFTEIRFEELDTNKTKVTWIIEIEVPILQIGNPLSSVAGKMAKTLYGTIITAGKKRLER